MSTGSNAVWYIVLLLPVLVALAWFYYRRTVPDVPPVQRRLLLTLRIITLAALAAALARPVFDWERRAAVPARWMRLVDYSASMDRNDADSAGSSRLSRALGVAADNAWSRVAPDVRLETLLFADSSSTDSAGLGREGTDIFAALDAVRQSGDLPAAVILISDGADNGGANPAGTDWPFPVFSICLGDSGQLADFAVVDIDAPGVAVAGDSVPVRVRVTASGDPARAVFTLRAGGHEELRTVRLEGGGRQQELEFIFRPDSAGVLEISAEVSAADFEATTANNRRSTRMFVEPRERRALLLALAPDWETAFLVRQFGELERLQLDVRYRNLSGKGRYASWPRSYDSIASYDQIILADMPAVNWLELAPWLKRYLEDKSGGLLLLAGPRAAAREWSDEQSALAGIRWTARPPGVMLPQNPVKLSGSGRFHPVTSLSDEADVDRVWGALPLLSGVLPSTPAPTFVALVETEIAQFTWPVLVAGRQGGGRVLSVLGYPLWRWDFAADPAGLRHDWSTRFWELAVRWLTSARQPQRLAVEGPEDPLAAYAPPGLSALLLDETWQPDSRANVSAAILDSAGSLVQTFQLVPQSAGRYAGEGRPLPPGSYSYRVRASMDTVTLAVSDGRFSTGTVSREALAPASRPGILDRLSAATGGRRLPADDWATFLDSLPRAPAQRVFYGTVRLWDSPWLLALVLGSLCIEWVLRRRFQML